MARAAKPTPPDADAALWAVAEGRHGDAFSVLGPHPVGKSWRLTVFQPGADRVTAVQGETRVNLDPTAVPGMFQGSLKTAAPYHLEAEGHGNQWSWDDPYRFAPVLGEMDEYLLGEGTHLRIWERLGAHLMNHQGVNGVHFAVWAPNAERVSVVGDFNTWDGRRHPMRKRGATGVWEIFVPGLSEGTLYKYEIRAAGGAIMPLKADPVGFGSEHPPANSSVVRSLARRNWHDSAWMDARGPKQNIDAPISIYEVHLPSWRKADNGQRPLSYIELASQLIDYVEWMGFTHIEFMPLSEFPFDGSWGYQPVGLFAPTIRMGTPDELRVLVNAAHERGIGVLLDWVPGHFPSDAHGLGHFDGTALYEHSDPREGFHQDWNTLIYNFGRVEVANFLYSNALYWLEEFHVDGLRVDAVASMLYRDYSRRDGQWVPNIYGGRENLEAIALFHRVNTITYGTCPGIMTVAEESTSFPGVSKPVDMGGLGFGFKWNMGWMNDTLSYMEKDPVHRKWHHHQMTFGLHYAWSENFILPISHDEVVHGKGSMLEKMPGTAWEKFANLRAYYGFMWAHPGKKLLFMGCEFAQAEEWSHRRSLDWHQCDLPEHRGVQLLVRDLNTLYRATPALHLHDTRPQGFEWLEMNAAEESLFAFARHGDAADPDVVVVINMTPLERRAVRIGFTSAGHWNESINTDAAVYGGGNRGNLGGIATESVAWHGRAQSAEVVIPPLSTLIFVKVLS